MFKQIYIQKSSPIHDLDFWTKLLSFLILLPLASFLAQPEFLIILTIIFGFLILSSKLGLKKFWRISKSYLIPITIGLIVLSLVFTAGNIQARILEGAVLSVRFALLISFGILFSMVTNPIEIPAGFLRAKIPHKYGVTLMVGYRMMPLLYEKITTIVQAQKARGASFRFSVKKPNKFFLQITSLVVPLLHATLSMSVRLSDALLSRGYNPEGIITVPPHQLSLTDIILLSVSIGLLTVSLI